MSTTEFNQVFTALTGHPPLAWQRRLYESHFARGALPSAIDLPTGLGKTMVMALWLIARARHPDEVPTRLVYVVDRRTVVDQATDVAEQLRSRCHEALGVDPPAISTLRGQLADNRDWSRDPTRPAIIIGTVDLIGSGLLFSGYRSSFKRRPLEAGLLGQDALLVLDEAHLSRPFEKLVQEIGRDGRFQKDRDGGTCGQPLRVIRMSATSAAPDDSGVFRLAVDAHGSLTGQDKDDQITAQRFAAPKRLQVKVLPGKATPADFAREAIGLAQSPDVVGKRIVVFVRGPDEARSIADHIGNQGSTKKQPKPFADAVKVLTGTLRGLERDKLVQEPVFRERWLNGDLPPHADNNQQPVFLISTSAGEVGFDLNADHMVCDSAPLDAMIQRLGRVNRRGLGRATIIQLRAPESIDSPDGGQKAAGAKQGKSAYNLACRAADQLFADGMDVSPSGIAVLKATRPATELHAASTPEPATVDLTDILLDAWSMTSIVTPMPGRPEVGPWLRGLTDDAPHTTIAWRAELDLPGFGDLDPETLEGWFDAHRVLAHETLTERSDRAADWFRERCSRIDPELYARPVVIDRDGLRVLTIAEVLKQLERKDSPLVRHAELILPASFGGIERGKGLLDPDAPQSLELRTSPSEPANADALSQALAGPDVADVRGRYRETVEKSDDGEVVSTPLSLGTSRPSRFTRFTLELQSDDDRRITLVSLVPPFERPEFGSSSQSLEEHVAAVCARADAILDRLPLPAADDVVRQALKLAAEWHDHGKNREFFQRTVGGKPSDGQRPWPEHVLGKSDGKHYRRLPRGYRHEFGSLRELTAAKQGTASDDVFDLAAHLIATHHGRGRPHFPMGGFDPDAEPDSEDLHTAAIRRFARLQRRYGWWRLAWLESLLRCADALASANAAAADQAEPEDAR